MNAIQVISLTLLSVLAANAQVIMPGRCPKPAVQSDFDAAKYLGTWYDIQRLPHAFQKGECSTATYNLKSPGVVGVLNRELLADGTISSISGSAMAKDPSEPAKLVVSFFENSPPAPYWVLSTDYDNYSLPAQDPGQLHVEQAEVGAAVDQRVTLIVGGQHPVGTRGRCCRRNMRVRAAGLFSTQENYLLRLDLNVRMCV
uniref:Apolipoprotein D n=1 Tax=Dicentrarchus labrax TaxID=13489 RepID=A0A8C4NYB4_DICLA